MAVTTAEEQKISPSLFPTAAAGTSVAISNDGSVAVIGSPGEETAYVWTRSGTTWSQAQVLTASDGVSGDGFGTSVSITGDATSGSIAVGSPNHNGNNGGVYVFTLNAGTWSPNTNNPLQSALTVGGHLGASVSIQGFRVAAGAPNTTVSGKTNTGVAVVFDSNNGGGNFTTTTFRPSGGQARNGSLLGSSIGLSGSTVVVGAPGFRTGSKANSGAAFVFQSNGGAYTQVARLRPANVANQSAGASVAIFNDTIVLGAPGVGTGAKPNQGAIYVYNRVSGTWQTTASVVIGDPGAASGDLFGSSVALLGEFIVAGAPGTTAGTGAAYVYATDGTSITQLLPNVPPVGSQFGFSASVNAGRALIGAPADATIGSAYVFKFLQPSITTITSTSVNPASTGIPYTVHVNVNHDALGTGTPTGTVHVDDGEGGSCDTAALDGSGNAQCDITSTFFGDLTLTATYNGDLSFSPSQGTLGQSVTGTHLEFNPAPPADITAGFTFAGTVEIRNAAEALVDDSTPIVVTITDVCGNPNVLGPVAAVHGIATFSGLGPRFYGVATGLSVTAAPDASAPLPGKNYAGAGSNVNVVTNTDLVFFSGYEECTQ